MRTAPRLAIPHIRLRRTGTETLEQQLYQGLRAQIVQGGLCAGTRLPSTRSFASLLGVSRNVVISAFERLQLEGYLAGSVGRGTFVAEGLLAPLATSQVASTAAHRGAHPPNPAALEVAMSLPGKELVPFRCDVPALEHFPLERWARLMGSVWRHARPSQLGYGDPQGDLDLRKELAGHLAASRGVRCTARNLVITAGSQQTLDLLARLFAKSPRPVWVEDPCYRGTKVALRGAGLRVVPVAVDEKGLNVGPLIDGEPPEAIFVTPAQHYPLGHILPLARRLELLEFCARQGSWLVEDDYEGELCLEGRPLPALQGVDPADRTIHVGSFSKSMFPALRLGYVVLPEALLGRFLALRAQTDRHAPSMDQRALAEFIAAGHFARHLSRMRTLYAERRGALGAQLATHCPEFSILPAPGGMHLTATHTGLNDVMVAAEAEKRGLLVVPLSRYYDDAARLTGLVLGFAPFSPRRLREGVIRLKEALRAAR